MYTRASLTNGIVKIVLMVWKVAFMTEMHTPFGRENLLEGHRD
jgi:peptidyl-tRNA hydrolase